jgi:AbrB family looped-hinge helix DNA binding protein
VNVRIVRKYESSRVGLIPFTEGNAVGKPGAKREPMSLFRARARVRPRAQLTLPEEIRRAMHIGEGDEIEFALHADGTVTVRGYVSVPSDQSWFFTPERLAGKQQADDEIAAGGGTVHGSAEAMFAHLGSLGAAD